MEREELVNGVATAMKSGKNSIQIVIPKHIQRELNVVDRDVLIVYVGKTGTKKPKRISKANDNLTSAKKDPVEEKKDEKESTSEESKELESDSQKQSEYQ